MEYGPDDKRATASEDQHPGRGGTRYATTPEICEKIASTFKTITKSTNYNPIFQNYKVMAEEKYQSRIHQFRGL